MRQGTLLFHTRKEESFTIVYMTPFGNLLFILLLLGFIGASVYYKQISYIIGWSIIVGFDILLEVAIIYFFKKDVIRKGKQVIESGSFWQGNKQYKGEIDYLTYNAN